MSRFNTLVEKENLYVVSDLHLGNPSFMMGGRFRSFLRSLAGDKVSLCINGDGLDLLQISLPRLMMDFPAILRSVTEFLDGGRNEIFYVIGNHDIYMSAFLEETGIFNVVPFLDLVSGDKRIHIEHGHLYDRFFLYYPSLYIQLTRFLGLWLKLLPTLFYLYQQTTQRLSSLFNYIVRRGRLEERVDRPNFMTAAHEILERGFDAVIFGHTHLVAFYEMDDKQYANPGSWIGSIPEHSGHYIEIRKGDIRLKQWDMDSVA
jgi:UDP-2,3-diacylglucosamine pyrophosphatase LpxH